MREPLVRIGPLGPVGRPDQERVAEVHGGRVLVEGRVLGVGRVQRGHELVVERHEELRGHRRFGRQAAGRAELEFTRGLVEEVVAEHGRAAGEALRQRGEGAHVLGADAVAVGPEARERAPHRRRGVVEREVARGRRERDAVVQDRPLRGALAGEALGVEVLVHVEQHPEALPGRQRDDRLQVVDVVLVDLARLRLQAGPDHAEPDRVEAPRAHAPEVRRGQRRVVRRTLEHGVGAVEDHLAPAGVDDAVVLHRQRVGGGGGKSGRRERDGQGGDQRSSPHP